MEHLLSSKKVRLWAAFLAVCLVVVGLVACAPKQGSETKTNDSQPQQSQDMPEPNEKGIITADAWAEMYPDQYASYQENAKNTEIEDYNELYPQLAVIWEGTPFSIDYGEARGHVYSLDDISATERPHATANCLSCKSSEFILMQDDDVSVNGAPFEDVFGQISEPISCYDCHRNEPSAGTVAIRQFFVDAIGADASKLPDESVMSCGQCHNEYYFEGDYKKVANPYKSLADATPEKVLAFENEIGYVDYTNPRTGTEHLKVQHPEFETIYGGEQSAMAKLGYSCADCHMAPATSQDGQEFTSHNWTSPLNNEQLLKDNCSSCHTDLKSEVATWQEETVSREHAIADKLVELNNKLADVVESGSKSDEEITKLRDLNRTSQFFWDWVMVENSEGAHNMTLTRHTLDLSEAAVDEALALL